MGTARPGAAAAAPRSRPSVVRNRMLATLTVVAVGFALRETAAVTVPLAFALFLVALLWPLTAWLARRMPSGVAVLGSTLVFLGLAAGFFKGLYETGEALGSHFAGAEAQIDESMTRLQSWAEEQGLPVEGMGDGERLMSLVQRSGRMGFEVLAGAVLVLAFLSLSLLEVDLAGSKIRRAVGDERADRIARVSARVGAQFRRYFWVRTFVGALTGLGCALGTWAIGLELWWLWGLLNFLLNYIPTLGSILGIVPPVLFALVQYPGDWAMPLGALGVVGGVQLVMGNWIDPVIQGRALSLSPVVVLFSVTFWGWIWGVVGALIGVPLTLLIVLVCRELPSTRWIATLLAEPEDRDEREPGDRGHDERGRGEEANRPHLWSGRA